MIKEASNALDGWLFYLHPSKMFQSEWGLVEYAIDTNNRVHIIILYIKPEHRRRGFAEGYVRMIQDTAKTVIAWTASTNKPAKSLFNKLGFLRQGEVHNFYPNGDKAIMWRWTHG